MKQISVCLLIFLIHFQAVSGLPNDYQNLSASEKLNILWSENLTPSQYKTLPEIESLGLFDLVRLSSKQFLSKSFDHESDEMPENRLKIIHPYGSVAQIEFVPSNAENFSGILKSGAIGLARLSLAGNPDIFGYTPGMAIKFLIDGKPSVNLHVMNSLSGQGSNQNFFALNFSNILPEPPFYLTLLAQAFSRVKNPPTELSVNQITQVESNGRIVSAPELKTIYQVVFQPNKSLSIDKNTKNDFRYELQNISSGSILYTVYARRSKNTELIKVGSLVTRSEFIASTYGDEKLFFQHQR